MHNIGYDHTRYREEKERRDGIKIMAKQITVLIREDKNMFFIQNLSEK